MKIGHYNFELECLLVYQFLSSSKVIEWRMHSCKDLQDHNTIYL